MAGETLGLDAKLYYNAGTYASPSWTEIANVRDLTLNIERDSVEVKDRSRGGSGAVLFDLGTFRRANFDFNLNKDTAAAGYSNLWTAFIGSSDLEFAVADGAIATSGTEYFRMIGLVTKFTRGQPLEDVETVDVSVKTTQDSSGNTFSRTAV